MSKELKQQILNEIATGATAQQCANKYNIPAGTIRSWVSREKKRNVAGKSGATKNVAQRKKETKKNVNEPVIKIEDVSENLTEKERLFCWRYIHNFNATQAYLWAFKCSYGTAGVEGHKLLKKPKIKAEIERLKKLKFEALQITPDDIVERYMRIAFADMTDFVEFGTKEEPIITEDGILKDANGNPITETVSYLDFKGAEQVDGGLICEISKGKQGIKIKLEDRQKALDWLSKFFEMNPMDKHKIAYDNAILELKKKELELKDW